MSRRYLFTCNRCGNAVQCDSECLPSGWVILATVGMSVDLCSPACVAATVQGAAPLTYHDSLRRLSDAARDFAAAITMAADMASRIEALPADEALAARTIDECRDALLPAVAKAPGIVQLFSQVH